MIETNVSYVSQVQCFVIICCPLNIRLNFHSNVKTCNRLSITFYVRTIINYSGWVKNKMVEKLKIQSVNENLAHPIIDKNL